MENKLFTNTKHKFQLPNQISSPMGGDGLITDALVENNILYNNGTGGGAGINMDGVQYATVRNNLLNNNYAGGITAFQQNAAAAPRGLLILNNTIDMASNGRWALSFRNTTGLNQARNNILYNCHSFRGSLEFGNATDVANLDSDFNLMTWITPDSGSTRYSLIQWQARGHDVNSLTASLSSLFVNSSVGDYHLLAAAPAIDHGEFRPELLFDRDGQLRPMGTSTDIGCYEFVTPSFVSTATALAIAKTNINRAMTITTRFINIGGPLNDGIIDMEIYNAAGVRANQQTQVGQGFTSSQSRIYTWSWTPTVAGTYTVKLGVYSGDGTQAFHWNDMARTVFIR